MSIFLTGRRSATTTLAQMHAYDLNLCTDLHCSRRTLTLAAPRSCAATSSTNALMGVGCHQPVRLPRANPHSARGTTACHFPRFRSLKAFGRRPRCTPRRRDRPASETLNNRDWAGQAARSDHVRNAPLATVGPKKAACRHGPEADVWLYWSLVRVGLADLS
jgi:hypothetical protein